MEDPVRRAAIHQSLPLGNVVHVVEDEAVGGEGEDGLGGEEAGIEEQPAHEGGLVRLVYHQDAVLDVLLHQEGVHVPAVVVNVVLV